MKGFKDFLMRGNLVELAVAFVMAIAFAAVVQAFVTIIMDVLGKIGGSPNFSGYAPGGVHVGLFLTTLITFIILAAVVFFLVVQPYTLARARFVQDDEEVTQLDLLAEIRDALRARG